jgi:hypothetical protein
MTLLQPFLPGAFWTFLWLLAVQFMSIRVLKRLAYWAGLVMTIYNPISVLRTKDLCLYGQTERMIKRWP